MGDGDEGGLDEVMNDLEAMCKGDDLTRCGVEIAQGRQEIDNEAKDLPYDTSV